MRLRDSQRNRVYTAEREMQGHWTNQVGTNAAAQEWVDRVVQDRWFQQRWRIERVRVVPGRTRGTSYGGQIMLAPNCRNPWVMLHEIAHEAISSTGCEVAPHGREFTATLLMLVRRHIGAAEANALRASYGTHRVTFRGGNSDAVPRAIRFAVPTQAESATRRRAALTKPPAAREVQITVDTLRRMARRGQFGAAGTRDREAALRLSKVLDKETRSEAPRLG